MDGDLGNDSDDDGKGTEETEDEQKWRLERMEREKFIMEQKVVDSFLWRHDYIVAILGEGNAWWKWRLTVGFRRW